MSRLAIQHLTGTVPLTERERDIIRQGIMCRICFIETGTVGMRAVDLQAQWDLMNEDERTDHVRRRLPTPKALSTDQMRLIIESEDILKMLDDS